MLGWGLEKLGRWSQWTLQLVPLGQKLYISLSFPKCTVSVCMLTPMGTGLEYLGRKGHLCSSHPTGMLLPSSRPLRLAQGQGPLVCVPDKGSLEGP